MPGILYFCIKFNLLKVKHMQEKIYHFYVLSTLSDPDNIRYVGVTTR